MGVEEPRGGCGRQAGPFRWNVLTRDDDDDEEGDEGKEEGVDTVDNCNNNKQTAGRLRGWGCNSALAMLGLRWRTERQLNKKTIDRLLKRATSKMDSKDKQ